MADAPFLCLSAEPEFWDRSAGKMYFLGPWCRRYDRPQDWTGIDYEILPHPYDDRTFMWEAAAYQERVARDILDLLVPFFNKIHGLDRPRWYWEMIVWPWMWHFVMVVHERYLCLKKAKDLLPRFQTVLLGQASTQAPRTFRDHMINLFEDLYNHQIYSSILRGMNYEAPSRDMDWALASLSKGASTWASRWKASRLGRIAGALLFRWALRGKVFMTDMYMPKSALFRLILGTRGMARWYPAPDQSEDETESDIFQTAHRAQLKAIISASGGEFHAVMGEAAATLLPRSFLETFSISMDKAVRWLADSRMRCLVSSSGLMSNDLLRICAAELRHRGGRIIGTQHGGLYGSALYFPNEAIELLITDEYWSWGWTAPSNDKVKPIPSPRLSLLRQARASDNGARKSILFVLNMNGRYSSRTWSMPSSAQLESGYLDLQIRFLKALGGVVRESLLVRPYLWDPGLGQRQRLVDACPWVRFQKGGEGYQRGMLSAGLVVTDINTTTFLEALAAKIPVVAFWNPELCELRPEAQAQYDALRQVNILHDSPESAGNALTSIWPNVGQWWDSDSVRQVRKEFTQNYAMACENWIHKWVERLKMLDTQTVS